MHQLVIKRFQHRLVSWVDTNSGTFLSGRWRRYIPPKSWFYPTRTHGVMTNYNTDGRNVNLKVNRLILISHIKFVCVFHCEAVILMKCARSDGHADLSHDRISCFP